MSESEAGSSNGVPTTVRVGKGEVILRSVTPIACQFFNLGKASVYAGSEVKFRSIQYCYAMST